LHHLKSFCRYLAFFIYFQFFVLQLAAKSEEQLAKERKRKEHVQRTLAAHQAGKRVSAVGKGGADDAASTSLYSAFQALFAKRAEGFVVDLKFRSAPPRPPVGPTFVGKGLAAELSTKWAEYRPGNAIEQSHTWKLHNEPDLGVSLGMFAMDWNGCYKVPKRARLLQNQAKANKKGGLGSNDLMNAVTDEEDEGALPSANRDGLNLHPHDAQLLNWTGSMVCRPKRRIFGNSKIFSKLRQNMLVIYRLFFV
jgi:hypothetical protein